MQDLGRDNPHGAFVYMGGDVDIYRLVMCNRDMCCGRLRQVERGFTFYHFFLPDKAKAKVAAKVEDLEEHVLPEKAPKWLHSTQDSFRTLWRTSPLNNAPVVDDCDSSRPDPSLGYWQRIASWLFIKMNQYLFMWYTIVRHILRPVDFVGAAFTVFVVWFFQYMDLYMDYSPGLVTSAIIFPIAFAINSSHQRREV